MAWSTHPLTLLLALLAGAGAGLSSPALAAALGPLGRLAGAVLEMAALPLLVVAAGFGLRSLLGLPHPLRRLAMGTAAALLTLPVCALLGAGVALALSPGQALDAPSQRSFGELVQELGGGAEDSRFALRAQVAQAAAPAGVTSVLPDNPFAALVDGVLPAVLWCTLVLSLPFACMARDQAGALAGLLEGVYRALEQLVHQANRLLPLLAFTMAAHLGAQIRWPTLQLLSGLLGALLLGSVLSIGVAMAVLARQARTPLGEVLRAMKAPLLIALVAPSPASALPSTIDALSRRLGLARGAAELAVPAGVALLAAGSALQAALVAVFVAQLHGLAIGPGWLGMVVAGAALAALLVPAAGAAVGGAAPATGGAVASGGLAAAALLLLWLRLPAEAVLPVLLLVDGFSRGLRQCTALACVAATSAVLAAGLPSEREAPQASGSAAALGPGRLSLGRGGMAVVLACLLMAGGFSLLVGVGLGLRQAPDPAASTSLTRAAP